MAALSSSSVRLSHSSWPRLCYAATAPPTSVQAVSKPKLVSTMARSLSTVLGTATSVMELICTYSYRYQIQMGVVRYMALCPTETNQAKQTRPPYIAE